MSETKEQKGFSVNYSTLCNTMTSVIANRNKHEDDDDPEDTPEFLHIMMNAHQTFEDYLSSYEKMPASFDVPSSEHYTQYWSRAPLHHFTVIEDGTYTVAEMVWLMFVYGRACVDHSFINRKLCLQPTILMKTLADVRRFRDMWCDAPLCDKESYVKLRGVYMSLLVFVIPEGVKELLRKGLITDGRNNNNNNNNKGEGKEEAKPSPPQQQQKSATSYPSISNALEHKDIAIFDITSGVEQWLQFGVKLFPFMDAVYEFMERFPPIQLELSEEQKAHHRVFAEWVRKKSEYSTSEDFKRVTLDLACRLALPIGSGQRASGPNESATPSNETLYRMGYGDKQFEVIDTLAMDKFNRIYNATYDTTDHRRFLQDSIAINLFRQELSTAINLTSYNWIKLYFVDCVNLRKRYHELLHTNHDGKGDRADSMLYDVLHIANAYYVFDGIRLLRCTGIVQALWWWTFSLQKTFHSVLDNDFNVKTRFIDKIWIPNP